MKIKQSGAKFSAIVSIGEKINVLEQQSDEKYLRLNRGMPAVTNIKLFATNAFNGFAQVLAEKL